MIHFFQMRHALHIIFLQVIISLYTLGCGFQPLHYEAEGTDAKWLASIQISKIPNRSGQKLRSFLLERFPSVFLKANPKYILSVSITEGTVNLGIRKDATATRAKLTVTADYSLKQKLTNKTIISGRVNSTNSYNILTSEFAAMSAENNARDRVLRTLAKQIQLRISAKYHQILHRRNLNLSPKK